MKILYPLVFFLFVIEGCTSIYFEEPQPLNITELNSFPENIQGTYVPIDGSEDTIFIKMYEYEYPEFYEKSIPMAAIDTLTDIRIMGDLVFDNALPTNNGINFTIRNDTLHYKIKLNTSTILSDSLVLKKFGKQLVLSIKVDGEKYWEVYLIKKDKNGYLRIFSTGEFSTDSVPDNKIKNDGQLKDYFSITHFKQIDDSNYLINPTEKEFKKLIRKDFFVEALRYKKVYDSN